MRKKYDRFTIRDVLQGIFPLGLICPNFGTSLHQNFKKYSLNKDDYTGPCVKGVGAQDSRSPTLEFVGRLGTGAGILPWTPYGEGGEIKSSKGRLGDNLFLD